MKKIKKKPAVRPETVCCASCHRTHTIPLLLYSKTRNV